MKTIAELNASKVPLVIIDKRLDSLDKIVLFPEKVEMAKRKIAKIGLPSHHQTKLSDREMELLKLLVNGLDYNAIAEKLVLSRDTVRTHIRNIYLKLRVHSKAEAIRLAMKKGWV
jgi:DNA-binding NarL/FixJ family response regulator